MTDNEIRQMLTRLQQDLANPAAQTAEWTHAEFIPLAQREKAAKILNAGYWLGNVLAAALAVYLCLTEFADDVFVQSVFGGAVALTLAAGIFSQYKYLLPAVMKREYALTQYKIDFKKERLEIWRQGRKTAQHKFHSPNMVLPPLPLPKAESEQEHCRRIRQKIQQQIQSRTGFAFR
ncbi:MAG: hypothetical protein Q3966_00375 [Neisseria sp.]|nr:hypothetical protein [Neisseria sp.]